MAAAASSTTTLPIPRLSLQYSTTHHHHHGRTARPAPLVWRSSTISASISERTPSPPTSKPADTGLPLRPIPGDYGLPLVGPIKDRQDFIYKQGREEFLRSRVNRYGSTVFRTNVPPGPFISPDPRVIALLDAKSFPTLFDVDKVEKRDVFVGTFMPSTDLTGGYRVLSYVDPSEPNHAKLKNLLFFVLQYRRSYVIPEFQSSFGALFDELETELDAKGKADFGGPNDQASFNFLGRALLGADPAQSALGTDAPQLIGKWVLFQLGPILSLGLPLPAEELLLRTYPLPPSLVKADYQRLYDFFYASSAAVLAEAERLGIGKEEACHNLVFALCFNSFGGMKIFFPSLLKLIGRAGSQIHRQLAEEIRGAVETVGGGAITMRAMEAMPLMKSVVYEAFRLEPPVPYQYGRAKKDLIVESHESAFKVKKGEMLFGFQPFATRDPKVFERAEEFVPARFIGEEGERLLKYVLWSNGPETEEPTTENKQCAGKNFVVLMARLLVVELFRRYDTFDVEVGSSPLGAAVVVTSLKRASN